MQHLEKPALADGMGIFGHMDLSIVGDGRDMFYASAFGISEGIDHQGRNRMDGACWAN